MASKNKPTVIAHRLSVHFQNIITPAKNPQKYLDDINHHVAVFREMLIVLGQENDCPELRIKIRKWRCTLIEECRITAQLLISLKNSCANGKLENITHFLVLFSHLLQLILRELNKCYRLMLVVPMDMGEYFENRPRTSNLGNVISEILLLKKQQKPDFISEELLSINLDAKQIASLLQDIQEFVPPELNTNIEIHNSWPKKCKRKIFCCSSLSR